MSELVSTNAKDDKLSDVISRMNIMECGSLLEGMGVRATFELLESVQEVVSKIRTKLPEVQAITDVKPADTSEITTQPFSIEEISNLFDNLLEVCAMKSQQTDELSDHFAELYMVLLIGKILWIISNFTPDTSYPLRVGSIWASTHSCAIALEILKITIPLLQVFQSNTSKLVS